MSINNYTPIDADKKAAILKRLKISDVRILQLKKGKVGKPFFLQVRDPETKIYDNSAFDDMDALEHHAKVTWLTFQTGEARAGRVLLETIRPRFMASKRQECDGTMLEAYNRIFDRLKEAGISDLKSPGLTADCLRMLEKLAAGRPSRIVDGKRIKKQRAWKAGTWNSAVSLLQTIGCWCTKKSSRIGMRDNPFDDFPLRTVQMATPSVYTVEEMRLLAQPKVMETEIGRMLVLLLLTGMRVNEVRWLRWSAFDWRLGVVNIKLPDAIDVAQMAKLRVEQNDTIRDERRKSIKTDEERHVPLQWDLIQLLKPWAGVGEGYVFSDRFMAMKSEQYMWRAKRMVFKELKIAQRPRALHVLRHTYACVLEGAGLPRAALKRQLGHSPKCNTTEGYLRAAHVIAKDVAEWRREFRLLPRDGQAGCNVGVTNPTGQGPNVTGQASIAEVSKISVTAGKDLTYEQDYGTGTTGHGMPAIATQRVPIHLTWVRFPSPAPIATPDFIVVLDEDQKTG